MKLQGHHLLIKSLSISFVVLITLVGLIGISQIGYPSSSNNSPIPESSNLTFTHLKVEYSTRNIEFGIYGITTISDTLKFENNASSPISYIYYCIEQSYFNKMNYFAAKTQGGGSLATQESLNSLNGQKTYIIYLNSPILPGESTTIVVTSAYANILELGGSYTTQTCSFVINIIPHIPYDITALRINIIAPSGASLSVYNPEGTVQGSIIKYYDRTNLAPFTVETVSGEYTYSTNTIIEMVYLNRIIEVNPWGFIKVTEQHYINNTGNLQVNSYSWLVPKDAKNITARDNIGYISGVSLSSNVNSDQKTRNATMNLVSNRSPLSPKTGHMYTVEYSLPLENYYFKTIRNSYLKININLLMADFLIKSQTTQVYLYAGSKILSSSLTPNGIEYDQNCLVLTFTDSNVNKLESKILYVEYQEDGFLLIFRPFIISLILFGVLLFYVTYHNKVKKESDEEAVILKEKVPVNEIREFISLYEEINAVRIDIQKLDEDVIKKKIARKQYYKNRKVLEDKLKESQDEIKDFKKSLLNAGGKIAQFIQTLDVKEAELIANEDSIKAHEEKYKKGKLPSKNAYLTLKDQMIKQSEKTQNQIDKVINELKAFLL